MKIALFGAGGMIGSRIVAEALERGHAVTAVVRGRERKNDLDPRVAVRHGDVLDAASVAAGVLGSDAVVSAVGPSRRPGADPLLVVGAARALVVALPRARVRRLLVVGGAGSLEVAPGLQLVDTADFPAAWRPVALAHRDALEVYRHADLDWTYASPAALIEPGARTGAFRKGRDRLVTDGNGESRISAEDFAVALVDELERPAFLRQRFTVAY